MRYRRWGGEIPDYISGCFAGATWVSQHGEPFTGTYNWGIYTNEAGYANANGYDLGTINPSLDGAWHHVLFVDQFTPTSIAKIYIDGELVFSLETNQYTDYIGIARIQFGNKQENPLGGVWAGDLAHFAVWARALDADEIARTYNFLKDEYGLT